MRFCTNHLFGGKIKDIMTGYRAFSYQFVKTYPVLSRGFEIETEMTIHALQRNMQVENVVIDYRDRPEGSESKLNTYSDGFKVLGTIGRLFKNYARLCSSASWRPFWRCLASALWCRCWANISRPGLCRASPR